MGRLDDKVAIVTGAGTGLGRETARLYAEEGAKVVVADIREPDGEETVRLIREAGGEAIFVLTDVADAAAVHALVAASEANYGKLNIMTANAGILGRGAYTPFVDLPDADFDQVMQVNLNGVVHAFKHAIPAIQRAGGGAMTATASLGGTRGWNGLEPYCASKGAVLALVRALSVELAPTIRVNAVSPGSMATQLAVHTMEDRGGAEFTRSSRMGNLADRPVAEPRQVAYAHLFLVSDESSFVNGHDLVADGGWGVIPA